MLRSVLLLVALALSLSAPACGEEDEDGGAGETASTEQSTATEAAAAEEALKDTTTKPEIPKPTGSPPRKLVKRDIVKGTGPGAKPGDTVVVHYVGMNFSNGFEFDASWDVAQPFPVQIGVTQVIEGWTRGLVGIRQGGRRMLTIPPELGYGSQGYPPDIPPNETLVFVVDALSVERGG